MTGESRADMLDRLRVNQLPTLIGLGAIGSWVARWLSANGIQFTGYDDDRVSLKNIAAGAFSLADVGRYKADVFSVLIARWDEFSSVGTSILVCADHGPSRRAAAIKASSHERLFVCAKANGSAWQVWRVDPGQSSADFCAFDEAAELDPVMVPCGESSVGRIASIGAAADLLTSWAGFEVTAKEVEESFGVAFDPSINHVINAAWHASRVKAESTAAELAAKSFAESIEQSREDSDRRAVEQLEALRDRRRKLKRTMRSTIHQRAMVAFDVGGYSLREAASHAINQRSGRSSINRVLSRLVEVEAGLAAINLGSTMSLPDTVIIEEVFA